MSSFLMCYSILHELNTLDACWVAVDVWSIVVDAGRSRSTCHMRDAYIHDHAYNIPKLCTLLPIARQ